MKNPTMRAKFVVSNVNRALNCEVLTFNAVCRPNGYPADGSDEDNTFAKFSPSAELKITVMNPNLFGKFNPGDKFYADFTPADA